MELSVLFHSLRFIVEENAALCVKTLRCHTRLLYIRGQAKEEGETLCNWRRVNAKQNTLEEKQVLVHCMCRERI